MNGHRRLRTFLQYASSENDADILYGSGFSAYDPFVFQEHAGRLILVVADFEVERARSESNADEVYGSFELTSEDARLRGIKEPNVQPVGIIASLLRKLRIRRTDVPFQFPVGIVKGLEKQGFVIRVLDGIPYPERLKKTTEEIRQIVKVQRQVELSMTNATRLLRQSQIQKDRLVLNGKTLCAEDLRKAIHTTLAEASCVALQTIVAIGGQAVEPHNVGCGPIRPHQSVVIDIFPRSSDSHYFADMTRTFVKGWPSAQLARQYQAVLKAQKLALSMIRPGLMVRSVHQAVQRLFVAQGFSTGVTDGVLQGFTHSTGHGVGLEIHEPPKIGLVPPSVRFRKGMVVTVEPGLYYRNTGGVRIEDLVVVTEHGIRNLTRYPKSLRP